MAEDQKLVFVADRENGRVQCFDLDGNFKQIIKHQEFGPRIFGVDYSPDHGKWLSFMKGYMKKVKLEIADKLIYI